MTHNTTDLNGRNFVEYSSARSAHPPKEMGMGQATPPPRTALVVEDEAALRDLAAAILEETDLRVVEAESGEEALHYLREHAVEVAFVFTDIRLDCLIDGVDLARTVSTRWPWIRVVVTSG